jgi:hypothetical protein
VYQPDLSLTLKKKRQSWQLYFRCCAFCSQQKSVTKQRYRCEKILIFEKEGWQECFAYYNFVKQMATYEFHLDARQ